MHNVFLLMVLFFVGNFSSFEAQSSNCKDVLSKNKSRELTASAMTPPEMSAYLKQVSKEFFNNDFPTGEVLESFLYGEYSNLLAVNSRSPRSPLDPNIVPLGSRIDRSSIPSFHTASESYVRWLIGLGNLKKIPDTESRIDPIQIIQNNLLSHNKLRLRQLEDFLKNASRVDIEDSSHDRLSRPYLILAPKELESVPLEIFKPSELNWKNKKSIFIAEGLVTDRDPNSGEERSYLKRSDGNYYGFSSKRVHPVEGRKVIIGNAGGIVTGTYLGEAGPFGRRGQRLHQGMRSPYTWLPIRGVHFVRTDNKVIVIGSHISTLSIYVREN